MWIVALICGRLLTFFRARLFIESVNFSGPASVPLGESNDLFTKSGSERRMLFSFACFWRSRLF
jgi:hypothetical protein